MLCEQPLHRFRRHAWRRSGQAVAERQLAGIGKSSSPALGRADDRQWSRGNLPGKAVSLSNAHDACAENDDFFHDCNAGPDRAPAGDKARALACASASSHIDTAIAPPSGTPIARSST